MTAPEPAPPVRLGRAAATMTGYTAASRATGFLRVLVVTAVLGTTYLGNTYQSANTVPNLLFELLAAGALQAVLVPTLVELLDREGRGVAQDAAGALLGTLGALLAGAAALAMLLSPLLMRVLVSGVDDPSVRAAEQRLGTVLLLFFLPQVVCYALGLVATGVLNAEHRFAVPAAAPIANNVVVMAAYALFWVLRRGDGPWPEVPLTPAQVLVLGGGTTLGVVVFTALPAMAVHRTGFRLRPSWGWRHPVVRRLARQGAWAAATVGATQVFTLVVLVLANAAAGGVVAFQFAFTFFLLPYALVAVPVATALYPTLARHAQRGAWPDFGQAVGRGLRAVLVLVVPLAAGLAALAWPIVRVAAFGQARGDLAALAHALTALALGLPGYAVVALMTRAAYSMGDARLPALVTGGLVLVGVAVAVPIARALPLAQRAAALGLAHSAAYTLGALVLLLAVRRRAGAGFGSGRAAFAALAAGLVAAAVMAVPALALDPRRHLTALAVGIAAGAAGLAVYGAVLRALAGQPLRSLVALGVAHA